MRLDDEQIERYSRQLILAEVGPLGQEKLGAARVAVVGSDVAAERVLAYLAAAGVGTIAADAALHGAVDPAQPDLRMVTLDQAGPVQLDAVVVTAPTLGDATTTLVTWQDRAAVTCWIAGPQAGGTPPCPLCAGAAASTVAATPPELASLRSAFLGTVVATEVVKALLGIGAPLAGSALTYDPERAIVTSIAVPPRPDCACRRASRAR